MGYHTEFEGRFNIDKPLTVAHMAYLKKFSETRRMKRNVNVLQNMPDPIREAVGLPLGEEGGYFVGGRGMLGQDSDASVIDHNDPPQGQPGLWCQWEPNELGTAIVWDEGEKFYSYVEWLEYLIEHFLKPWGYILNGRVTWQGDDRNDRGVLSVKNNVVKAIEDVIQTYSEDEGEE